MMRSGMPCPPQYGGAPISNIRNTGDRIGDARAAYERRGKGYLAASAVERGERAATAFAGRAVAGCGEGVFDDLDSGI
jgi:hypothetical protein